LHYAAFYGLLGIVKYLIADYSQGVEAHGFGDKCTALYVALVQEHFEVARVLLSAVTTGEVGEEEHAKLTQARAFLEHGRVATAQNKNGSTPLHFASDRGYLELARALLKHGADATARDGMGQTPLELALFRKHHAAELARELQVRTLTGII
jgi:ankyrin repeat protein